MLRRRGALATLSIGLLGLTACSADAADETPSATSPSAETAQEPEIPTPTPPARNDRGDLIKEIGEPAGTMNEATNEQWLDFAVTEITEAECTHSYGIELLESSGNHVLAVKVEGSTAASMSNTDLMIQDPSFSLNLSYDWVAFNAEGQRMNNVHGNTVYNCLEDGSLLPYDLGPAESFEGIVLLEVSDRAGEIAFRPWWLDGGWTWSYDLDGPERVGA